MIIFSLNNIRFALWLSAKIPLFVPYLPFDILQALLILFLCKITLHYVQPRCNLFINFAETLRQWTLFPQ